MCTGKTSLIRQLVGEELKFEPELEQAHREETKRQELDTKWLEKLCKHESDLERGIETKRLASLLSSQIELQQLLLQQQRGSFAPKPLAEPTKRRSIPSGNDKQEQQRASIKLNSRPASSGVARKPTILINDNDNSSAVKKPAGEPSAAKESLKRQQPAMALAPSGLNDGEPKSPNANHVPSAAGELGGGGGGGGARPDSPIGKLLSVDEANQQASSVNESASSNNKSTNDNNQQQLKQKSLMIENKGAAPPTNGRPNYRHSYGGPVINEDAANPAADNQSGSPQANQQGKQSELSTQAKIINILFTRNNQSSVGEASSSQSSATAAEDGSRRPLLMPSLLRQYQRRLSNFHHQSNAAGKHAAGKHLKGGPDDDPASSANNRQAALAAAKAAASLATAAASAAQALQLAQQTSLANADSSSQLHLAGCDSGAVKLDQQFNLYALTREYRRKLDLSAPMQQQQQQRLQSSGSGKQQPPPPASWPPNRRLLNPLEANLQRQSIKHFSVNYINNLELYEISIIDMPPIEPMAFPTSSLIEWTLFKGRSHLLTADAYLLVFDLTRPSTIQYIKMLRDKIFESREMSQIPVYVVANKADLCPTLQPSLQARRMRNVAHRRYQANVSASSAINDPAMSLQSVPAVGQQQQQPGSGTSAQVGYKKLSSGNTRSVPAAAAHQLLAAYKVHRMRLGSAGPIASLRRWAKLRRAIVIDGSPAGHPATVGACFNPALASHWTSRSSMHYSLILGASGPADRSFSRGHQWGGMMGRAYKRFKCYLSESFEKTFASGGGQFSAGPNRRRQSLATNRPQRLQRRGQRRRRRGQTRRRHGKETNAAQTSDGSKTAGLLSWIGIVGSKEKRRRKRKRRRGARASAAQIEQPAEQQQPQSSQQTESKFMVGQFIRGRLMLKRKRRDPDQSSNSGASKSGSFKSHSGNTNSVGNSAKRNKQETSYFKNYSKLLTNVAKQQTDHHQATGEVIAQASSNPEPAGGSPTVANLAASGRRIEPIFGSMSTQTSRQTFYELFNKLLQTSSTTAAKSQLKLTSNSNQQQLQRDRSHQESQLIKNDEDETDKKLFTGSNQLIMPRLEVNSPSSIDTSRHSSLSTAGKTRPSRRKSSSTGAALWQTLSSYALARKTSRTSISSAGDQSQRSRRDSALAQAAKDEAKEQQSRRQSGLVSQDGLHLGTDQYLSVDMLRKLSLISSNSQVSSSIAEDDNSGAEKEGQEEQGDRGAEEEKRSKSVAGSALTVDGQQQDDKRASSAASGAGSGRGKKIWYRGMVKKILFHSNDNAPPAKPSLRGLISALEWQKKANDLDRVEAAQSVASGGKEPGSNQQAGISAGEVNKENSDQPVVVAAADRSSRRQSLAVPGPVKDTSSMTESDVQGGAAPSIRIIASGSSMSLMSQNSGKQVRTGDSFAPTIERDWNNNNKGPVQKGQQLAAVKKGPSTNEVQLQLQQQQHQNMSTASIASKTSSLSRSSSRSSNLSLKDSSRDDSLSDSISLSLDTLKAEQTLAGMTGLAKPQNGLDRREVQSAGPAATRRSANEDDGEPGRVHSDERGSGAVSSKDCLLLGYANALEEAQLAAGCTPSLRKLSADDCLIINRHRRQSLATASNEDSWLLVNCRQGSNQDLQRRADGSQSADIKVSVPKISESNAESATNLQLQPQQQQQQPTLDAEGRRQSIKASIEAAIHLLVPRAKGSRSASITLGAADCEQRSRSRLGTSIVGAVNVHRTWRDWRQLLSRKKMANEGSVGGSNSGLQQQPGEAQDGAQPALNLLNLVTQTSKQQQHQHQKKDNQNKKNSKGSGAIKANGLNSSINDPHSPIVGFLNSQAAYNKLSSSQQREAAINFDQLMRINQLTLSAANVVMMSSTNDHHHQDSSSASAAAKHEQQQQQLAVAAAAAVTRGFEANCIVETTSGGGPGKKHSKVNKSAHNSNQLKLSGATHKDQQTLLTRVQSVGAANMNSHSSSDHRHKNEPNFADILLSSTSNNEHTSKLNQSTGPREQGASIVEISAQIAAAAASALERQKRRGEELSLILEPRYDKKQPGAQYPLFVSHDLNPILKDLAQLVRKHWKCNYIECSAASNWNIRPIISELTRTLECNNRYPPSHDRNASLGANDYGYQNEFYADNDDDDEEDDGYDFDDESCSTSSYYSTDSSSDGNEDYDDSCEDSAGRFKFECPNNNESANNNNNNGGDSNEDGGDRLEGSRGRALDEVLKVASSVQTPAMPRPSGAQMNSTGKRKVRLGGRQERPLIISKPSRSGQEQLTIPESKNKRNRPQQQRRRRQQQCSIM